MARKKAVKLILDDDDDWDDIIEEEDEIDDIIDDEEEDLDDEEENNSNSRRQGSKGSKKSSMKKGRKKRDKGLRPFIGHPVVKWTGRILITFIVVFLLFAPVQPLTDIRDAAGLDSLKDLMRPYQNLPEWVNVTVELNFDVTIRNGAADLIDIQIATPFDIPLEPQTGTRDFIVQDVESILMTPPPTKGEVDFNNEFNVLSGWRQENRVPGLYNYIARYEMRLYTYEWKMTEEDSGTIDDIPQSYKNTYLQDDWPVLKNGDIEDEDNNGIPDHYRYNPSHPKIKSIAETITRDEPTVYGKVKAIYNWMTDHFNYTSDEERIRDSRIYGDMPKWASGCLTDWYGDCDDQSLLMASFCRAVGIPAWLEIGYLYDTYNQQWGGHGWFNVVIPKKGSSTPVIAPIDPVNFEFLFRDPFRITDWIDNGSYIEDDKGRTIYNLDRYYNYFSMKHPTFVEVVIDTSFNSVRYEEHGKIKRYVDKKFEPGNLQGSEQGLAELPLLNPIVVLPIIMLIIAIPARKWLIKRVDTQNNL